MSLLSPALEDPAPDGKLVDDDVVMDAKAAIEVVEPVLSSFEQTEPVVTRKVRLARTSLCVAALNIQRGSPRNFGAITVRGDDKDQLQSIMLTICAQVYYNGDNVGHV